MLYLRAVYANKITLMAFFALPAIICLLVLDAKGICTTACEEVRYLLALDIYALAITTGGIETMYACKRSLKHIERIGRPDHRFAKQFGFYCGRAGYRLAVKIWHEQRAQ